MIYFLLAGIAAYLLAKSTRTWGAYALTPVASIFVAAGNVVLVSTVMGDADRASKVLIQKTLMGLCSSPFVIWVLIWLTRRLSTEPQGEESLVTSLGVHRRAAAWVMASIAIGSLIFWNAEFPDEKHEHDSAQGIISKAKAGDVEAQLALADSYSGREKFGLKKDLAAAVTWYRQAAEKGDAEAQHKLGDCYLHGQGVATNQPEAVKWYRKAAETGYAEAQTSLGFCYENGFGIPQDLAEARRWYTRAASQGDTNAQALLKSLK